MPEVVSIALRYKFVPLGLQRIRLPGIGNTFLDKAFIPRVNQFMFFAQQFGVGLQFNFAYRTPKVQQEMQRTLGSRRAARKSLQSAGFAVDAKLSGLLSLRDNLTQEQKLSIVRISATYAGLESGESWAEPEPWHFMVDPNPGQDRGSLIDAAFADFQLLTWMESLTYWR
jgi:hypothetical protein